MTADRDPASRVADLCDECGQVDTDPKHHELRGPIVDSRGVVVEPARFVSRHLDCCAARGCIVPDDHPGHCGTLLKSAKHAKGADLVKHLTSLPAEHSLQYDNDPREAARQKARRS